MPRKKTFSIPGVFLIVVLLLILFAILAETRDYTESACTIQAGIACRDVLLPNGESLADYYSRTGRIPTLLH
jgi:hypothetical protein